MEELDLTAYDLVLSSDSGPVKGVITRPDAVHICYCHSPMRYLWDGYHAYRNALSPLARVPFSLTAHYLRNWDYLAAQRVTHFLANSRYVAGRIRHYYGQPSTVIHPPIDTVRGILSPVKGDYYLAAGRLVGYKRTEIMIDACNRLRRRLLIAGEGPEYKRLRALAGPTVEFLGAVDTQRLWQMYAECRALLFAADEDFGMVPLEAQACGRPVIAYGKGGSLETVRAWSQHSSRQKLEGPPTGIFFYQQDTKSLLKAILQFEATEGAFSPAYIQAFARQFDTSIFRERMAAFVSEATATGETTPVSLSRSSLSRQSAFS